MFETPLSFTWEASSQPGAVIQVHLLLDNRGALLRSSGSHDSHPRNALGNSHMIGVAGSRQVLSWCNSLLYGFCSRVSALQPM